MKKVLLLMFCIPFFLNNLLLQSKGDPNRPMNVPIGNITKSNYIIIDNVPIYKVLTLEDVDRHTH